MRPLPPQVARSQNACKPLQVSKPSRREPRETTTAVKNYITPDGLQRLKDEHRFLLTRERPAVTKVVAWAASNGDRSENADYQYNKRRLRQIDWRIRYLMKRIDVAEVIDPGAPRTGRAATHIFFGATVRYAKADGTERVVSIVGIDEVDLTAEPDQLDLTARARVDEVRSRRLGRSSRAGKDGTTPDPSTSITSTFASTHSRNFPAPESATRG